MDLHSELRRLLDLAKADVVAARQELKRTAATLAEAEDRVKTIQSLIKPQAKPAKRYSSPPGKAARAFFDNVEVGSTFDPAAFREYVHARVPDISPDRTNVLLGNLSLCGVISKEFGEWRFLGFKK